MHVPQACVIFLSSVDEVCDDPFGHRLSILFVIAYCCLFVEWQLCCQINIVLSCNIRLIKESIFFTAVFLYHWRGHNFMTLFHLIEDVIFVWRRFHLIKEVIFISLKRLYLYDGVWIIPRQRLIVVILENMVGIFASMFLFRLWCCSSCHMPSLVYKDGVLKVSRLAFSPPYFLPQIISGVLKLDNCSCIQRTIEIY